MKKRLTVFAFLLMTVCVLVSCGRTDGIYSDYTPAEISEFITETQTNPLPMYTIKYNESEFDFYISNNYGINPDILTDGVVKYINGSTAHEIAVLRLGKTSAAEEVESSLQKYIETRIDEFYGYQPEQVELLEHSKVISKGDYIALLICDEASEAENAFIASFGKQPFSSQESTQTENTSESETENFETETETNPITAETEISDEYDGEAVLSVWRGEGGIRLSEKNQKILTKASSVISQIINDEMSDYEKELAIHDWIIDNTSYDLEADSKSKNAEPNPNNDNPYGVLIDGTGICSGYSSAFQLFMDMLDIGCITINGTSGSGGPHAWNMVYIENEWYCIDVTWDDPIGNLLPWEKDNIQHKYFNVTSEYMRKTKHEWIEAAYPEAKAKSQKNK